MKTREEQIQIIVRQAELEKRLSLLYGLFSRKFPMSKLWTALAAEEKKHDEILKKMLQQINDGDIYFYLDDITEEHIKEISVGVNKEIERTEKFGTDLKKALETAYFYENMLLEKKIFSSFDSESPAMLDTLDTLKKETEKHRDLLSSALEKFKKGYQV